MTNAKSLIISAQESVVLGAKLSPETRARLASEPITRELLERMPSPNAGRERLAQWVASREALAQALAQGEVDAPGKRPTSVSVAHTDQRAQAAICFAEAPGTRVGVDIEECGRELSTAARERVISAEEERICGGLEPLAIWVIKEAAFKAMPRERQGVISGVRIREITSQSPIVALISEPEPASVELHEFADHWYGIALHEA